MNFEIAKRLETAARTAGMNAFVVMGDTYGLQFESNRFDKLFVSFDAEEVVDYICRNSSADQNTVATVHYLINLHNEKVIAKASKLIDFVAQRRMAAALLEIAACEEQVAA